MTISNCGHDENNKYRGGKAGDQTGGEWRVRPWYNGRWNVVMRHPDLKVRRLIADMAKKAAENDLIGYDQSQRLTFWEHLKASGYKPENITIACEADCSSGVGAIVKGAGYRLGNDTLKNVSPSIYSGNERAALRNVGFKELCNSKYLTSDAYLLAGDVLINEGVHTAINLTNGKMTSISSNNTKLIVDGVWGRDTTYALQKILGTVVDGIVSGQSSLSMSMVNKGGLHTSSWRTGHGGSMVIKALQKKVGVNADGYFGINTCKALQRYLGTTVDGIVDNHSDMVKSLQRKINAGKI